MRGLYYITLFLFTIAAATTQTNWTATNAGEVDLSPLLVKTRSGQHFLWVELAETHTERQLGLMHRPSLKSDHGMLFDYGFEQPISMWMKNTFIPLDMIFIALNGRVAHLVEATVPLSGESISSPQPARAVLELNAGSVRRYEIKIGDTIIHPIFAND